MPPEAAPPPDLVLDQFVRSFEQAQERLGQTDLAQFLPPADHPLYPAVLRELVRVDLEYGWECGRARSIREYQQRFPRVFREPADLGDVAFEEYRLRCQAGQHATPEEYAAAFGIDVTHWPRMRPASGPSRNGILPQPAIQGWPEQGTYFQDFEILREIGRGAFARVYLARQTELAARPVVLKVSPRQSAEPQALAQLQHTHIVPIYSVHRQGPWQALCMPYFGATTLADVLRHLAGRVALPASGRDLLDTVEARRDRTLLGEHELVPATGSVAEALTPPQPATTLMLQQLPFVDAVLWLGLRLADGLAHAHERGILHRDLKPANVLLTDDGQPMLLDFNLARDLKADPTSLEDRVAGTLPYMAPEQLANCQGEALPVDVRADLYALGVLLYELLAGRHPFPLRTGPLAVRLKELRADRAAVPVWLCQLNPAVSPAAASLVQHCLEPSPGRRYPSAHALHEDLQRQLAHLPLRHAPEPSLRERAAKWQRRHPRLTSSATVSLGALLLLLGMLAGFHGYLDAVAQRQDDIERTVAVESMQRLGEEMKTLRYTLRAPHAEAALRAEGWTLWQQVMDRYRVLAAPPWQQRPAIQFLKPTDQQRLRTWVGELLLLKAQAQLRQAEGTTGPRHAELLAESQELLEHAQASYAPDRPPPTLWQLRAEAARLAGDAAESVRLRHVADATPWDERRDAHLRVARQLDLGHLQQVIQTLFDQARGTPDHPLLWLLVADCYTDLGRPREALHYYNLAILQQPDLSWAYARRGAAHLTLRQPREALADLDRALRDRVDPAVLFNRALARLALKDLVGTEADLTQLLGTAKPPVRALLLRARVREQLGNGDGARQDRELAFQREPCDEVDWTSRALARLPGHPREALTDLDRALALNPRYRNALQNKAHVLSDHVDRATEALPLLDQLVASHPDYRQARAGRGVVLARLRQRDAAHQDAAVLLAAEPSPEELYQVACIFALTSRDHAADRPRALQHLSTALGKGYGVEHLTRDRDLDPLRDDPEFRRLAEAAQTLRARSAARP